MRQFSHRTNIRCFLTGFLVRKMSRLNCYREPWLFVNTYRSYTRKQGYFRKKRVFEYHGDPWESYNYENGAIAATKFECKKTGNKIEFTIFPVEGSYEGMYLSRTYELEIDVLQCPAKVLVNNVPVTNWLYGEDHRVRVNLYQQDVMKKVVVKLL